MDLEKIKKDAIAELNEENERATKERVREIMREISSARSEITNKQTRIVKLQKELRDIEVVAEITTENIL